MKSAVQSQTEFHGFTLDRLKEYGPMANTFAVVMAGGVGARFWPRSREKTPKQLLEIAGPGTMIQNTVKRLEGIVDSRQVFVVTNKVQKALVIKQLPSVPPQNVLVEPVSRNTAPCIGLAALFIRRLDPHGVVIALPADHVVENLEDYQRVLRLAVEVAEDSGSLVTIGIQPKWPETGYGYIQFVNEDDGKNKYFSRGVYRAKTFAEKPNLETAERFLASGDFLWNSGMFLWRVDVIVEEIKTHLPDLYQGLMKLDGVLGTDKFLSTLELVYGVIRGISIDYGIMEKAQNVLVIKGVFGWSDVGSWDEVYRIAEKDEKGNCTSGRVILKDTSNSLVYSNDRLTATIGVDDLIVISTEDAVLICRKGKSQEVKEVVDHLKRRQLDEYL
jgi:mannose-1-phosphate guanylyltransferase